ncbi:XisI protein [Aerosakkonemataceae cyanobacterium BLCC-F50]|uniref:XisI protein n=1 Tax=Floridaenema flaviceps BLCC-F50 TaxID=3153642 RepID=A0ABV4XTL8_9CYAN
MDRVAIYGQYIENIINEYAQYKPAYGEVEIETIFDRERNHYLLYYVGWDGYERMRGCVLHVDIKNEKIWIQHDGTKGGIANDLLALGVPKEDIVLAFHAPTIRKYTEFAVG